MNAFIGAILAVVTGFGLSEFKIWLTRRKRHRAHWGALKSEIEFCGGLADTYINDAVIAPLYRLPTVFYQHALPALLADGELRKDEADTLMKFYSEAETLNRGLDLATTMREKDDRAKLEEEAIRNITKAERLTANGGGLYLGVRKIVTSHLD